MLQHGRARRVGERDIAEANFTRRCRVRAAIARAHLAGRTHRRLQSQHRSDGSSGSVKRPTESAERNHRHSHRALHVDDGFPEADAASVDGIRQ